MLEALDLKLDPIKSSISMASTVKETQYIARRALYLFSSAMTRIESLETKFEKGGSSIDIAAREQLGRLEQQMHLLAIRVESSAHQTASPTTRQTQIAPGEKMSFEQQCTIIVGGFQDGVSE